MTNTSTAIGAADDSLLLCASDLQHSAIYDNHVEMQACIRAVANRIAALAAASASALPAQQPDTANAALPDDREAFKTYLKECDECAIVPDVAGAFNAAWQIASRGEAPAGAARDPWREHLAEQADVIDCEALQRALVQHGISFPEGGMEHFRAALGEMVNRFVRFAAPTTQADSQPAPVRDERKEFEAWARDTFYSGMADVADSRKGSSYSDMTHHMAWYAYQAGRASRAPADSVTEDTGRLDWLDADGASRIFHVGPTWYTRASYGYPYRKRANLRAAIDAARKHETAAMAAKKGYTHE